MASETMPNPDAVPPPSTPPVLEPSAFSRAIHNSGEPFHSPPYISSWTTVGNYPSPVFDDHLHRPPAAFSSRHRFVNPRETILRHILPNPSAADPRASGDRKGGALSSELLRTGPAEKIAFHPKTVRAAVVTTGGLCPGMNTLIREIFLSLTKVYGVEEVFAVPYGYTGFTAPPSTPSDASSPSPLPSLTPLNLAAVDKIHHRGGSILGSVQTPGFDADKTAAIIGDLHLSMVFVIGGGGSMAAASLLSAAAQALRLKTAIIGIPGSTDNDIPVIDKSYGFDTATRVAIRAVKSAYVEATSAVNGVGLVKLPGKACGQIACYAALGSQAVDFVLIPELKFRLDGPKGLFQAVLDRFKTQGFAVIVVSEGAGAEMMGEIGERAESKGGKRKAAPDVGEFLKKSISAHFSKSGTEVNVKYIDPCSMIRTTPPVPADNLMTSALAQAAVHSAFAGMSGVAVGFVNNHSVVIPLETLLDAPPKLVDLSANTWERVRDLTRQPAFEKAFQD